VTLETKGEVIAELRTRGIAASLEYPEYIEVAVDDVVLVGGDANDEFGIDVCEQNSRDVIETIETNISSKSTDVQAIADLFACVVTQSSIIQKLVRVYLKVNAEGAR
jgi:hypothetical protein